MGWNGIVAVSYRNGLGGIERRCGSTVVQEGEGLGVFGGGGCGLNGL